MTPRQELLAWLRAARGAVRWHVESGDDRLSVPAGFVMPPLGRVEVAPRPAAPTRGPAPPPASSRAAAEPQQARAPSVAPAVHAPVLVPVAERSGALEALTRHVGDCSRCALAEHRRAIVHAVGPADARLAIVAEAPSADDEISGQPFRGAAGELLEKMIVAMGLSRDTVYLATVVMCRPPDDREATANEIAACGPYLKQRLGIVRPEVIVAFGELPMRALVPGAGSIPKARGKWLDWEGIPVMPTWGPTSLLADAEKKRPAWDDLKKVMARLGLTGPKKPT